MKIILEQSVTPTQINSLADNEIFVFGSNMEGKHYGGAARFAVNKFGAEMGNPVGLQGQSYAIPTLTAPGETKECRKLPLSEIGRYVQEMANFARENPDMFFYVTPIGCGIAGFSEQEIAPLFRCCLGVENIALPQSFLNILNDNGQIMNENKTKNMKRRIRITESDLRRIVKESVEGALDYLGLNDIQKHNMLGQMSHIDDIRNADPKNPMSFKAAKNKFKGTKRFDIENEPFRRNQYDDLSYELKNRDINQNGFKNSSSHQMDDAFVDGYLNQTGNYSRRIPNSDARYNND